MKRISILLLSALLFLVSCEDFLVKVPGDELPVELSIVTIDDAYVALNGVYSNFKSASYYGRNFVAFADVQTDALQSVIGYSNQLGEMYKWSYLASDGSIEGAWYVMYNLAVKASNLIDALPEVEGDVALKNMIEGEARIARAIAHFDLVKAFAPAYTQVADPVTAMGVPIVEHYELDEPARDPLSEVYAFIVADAKKAIELMPDATAADVSSVYLTKSAAQALLARVYLYMGDYGNAVTYSTAVIDNPSYSLAADSASYAGMFLTDMGSEVIWKVGLTSDDFDGRYIGYNYYNTSQGLASPDYIPAQWVIDQFAPTDLRADAALRLTDTKFGWDWPLVWKYPGNPEFYTDPYTLTTNANMYKAFRLSEMYLIRAEANAMQDQDVLALTDYNFLRSKRIIPYANSSISGDVLKDAIWNERKLELCFEGHYFWDLKRTGKGFARVLVNHPTAGQITNGGEKQGELSVDPDNHRWLWPIPQDEISANSNMDQNDNY